MIDHDALVRSAAQDLLDTFGDAMPDALTLAIAAIRVGQSLPCESVVTSWNAHVASQVTTL